jgi:hypothetical protein
LTLVFDDPFADNKLLNILSKLTDTAVERNRKTPANATKTPPKSPSTNKPRQPAKPKPTIGGVPT